MALGAMANNPNVKVKLVPVGLSYFHAHRFRSRAVIEFGPALDVPEEFVEKFKQGGPEKREAVSEFLDLVYEALKTVTIRAPDYDTLMVGGHGGYYVANLLNPTFSLFRQRDDCTSLLGST
jgi:glycerol-3-phosphate O-acyltransferase/dihydroxyacetone phosphate acyltransferase